MRIYRFCAFFFAFVSILLLSSGQLLAREDDIIAKEKTKCATRYNPYTILVLEHNPPFSWVTKVKKKNVEAYGIGVYILKEVLDTTGVSPDYRITKSVPNRDEFEERAWHNGVDSAIGIQYYPLLKTELQDRFLHPAYMSNPIVAVFAKGKEKDIQSSSDLVSLTGAIIATDNIEFLFPSELYLASVNNVREAFTRLLAGKLDYILMGYYTANMEAEKFKVKDKIFISEKPLRRVNNFLTLHNDRDCKVYKQDFDNAIRAITSDKQKMQNLLYRAYQEYEEQNKLFPVLEIKEDESIINDEF